MNRYSVDDHSHHDYWLLNKLTKQLSQKFEEHLKSYLIQNLREHGFYFCCDDEFIEFFKSRVYRISFADRQNEYFFYVDFVDDSNKGLYIGNYSTEVTIEHEANKITATIGKTFKSMIAENRKQK